MGCAGWFWLVLLFGLTSDISGRIDKTTRKKHNELWTSGDEANQKNDRNTAEFDRNLLLTHHKVIRRPSNRPFVTIVKPKGTSRHISSTKGLTIVTVKDDNNRQKANDKVEPSSKKPRKETSGFTPELIEQSGEASGDGSGDESGSGDFKIGKKRPVFSRYEQVIYHKSNHIHFHQHRDKPIKAPVPIDLAFQAPTVKPASNTQTQTQPPTQAPTQSPTQAPTQPPTQPPTRLSPSQVIKLTKQPTSPSSGTPKATAKTPGHRPNYLPQPWIPAGIPDSFDFLYNVPARNRTEPLPLMTLCVFHD